MINKEMKEMQTELLAYKLVNLLARKHLGAENGIKRDVLAWQLGVHERSIRKAVKKINESPEIEALVSTSHSIYMCNTKSECEQAINNTYRMAISLFKKAKAMEKKMKLNGQIKIPLGDDYEEFVQTFTKGE